MNLWDETHIALSNGKWVEARRCLDDLAREQVTDRLLDLKHYVRLSHKTLPEGFHAVLQDRIDLVNSKVEAHRPTGVKIQECGCGNDGYTCSQHAITPEVEYIPPAVDPSIAAVVQQSQQNAHQHRRMLGINLPENPRSSVTPFAWR